MEQQVREDLRKEMVDKAKEEVDLQVEKKLKKLQEKKLAEEKEKAALAEQTQGTTAEVQRLRDAQQAERQKQQELQQKLLAMQSKVRPRRSWGVCVLCCGKPLARASLSHRERSAVGSVGARRREQAAKSHGDGVTRIESDAAAVPEVRCKGQRFGVGVPAAPR